MICCRLVAKLCLTLLLHQGLFCSWDFSDNNTGLSCHPPSPRELTDPETGAESSALQADSLPLSHKGSLKTS